MQEPTNMKWSFYQVWNKSLEEGKTNRILEPRQKIWASELGGSYIDRYLKMTAIQPSNPPNPRSLRKFEAGNIWEAIVGYVLKRAGILQSRQDWIQYQYEGLLPVSGKLDFIGGGKPDYEKAYSTIQKEFDWLPEFISRATANIIQTLKTEYPNGLTNIILEIKSCSSFMFELYEKNGNANPQHKMQLFHYLKCKNMPEGHIVYISKDDARMIEIGVLNPSLIENNYKNDIENISNYVLNKIEPPKEKFIVFAKKKMFAQPDLFCIYCKTPLMWLYDKEGRFVGLCSDQWLYCPKCKVKYKKSIYGIQEQELECKICEVSVNSSQP